MSFIPTGALDELAISRLILRERWYRDTCQWEQLRSCYHPEDGKTRINISWIESTADGFVQGSKRMSEGGTDAIHSVAIADIRISENRAIVEAPASIMIRFQVESDEYELVSYARLGYQVEKIELAGSADEWRILRFGVIYVRDMIVPVAPGMGSLLPDVGGLRESYKYLTWVLKQKGFDIAQNLPGVDRPDTVTGRMQELNDWLLS